MNMRNNKFLLKVRLAGILLLIVLVGGILIYSKNITRKPIGASTGSEYARAVVTEVLEDNSVEIDQGQYEGTQRVKVKINSGIFQGEECEVRNSNGYHLGAYCKVGTKVIILVNNNGGTMTASIYNYDRDMSIWIFVALFLGVLCLVGGKKGVTTSISLIFTMLCIICLYIPMIYSGQSPYVAAVVTVGLIMTVSILLLCGMSRLSVSAILGTFGGVLIAAIIAISMGELSHISGYNVEEVESLVYIKGITGLKVGELLFSGILISTLGAVMDVSVSIASAIQEVYATKPTLTRKELFCSGMRVGRDMMGTMSNTLILAFVGGSVATVLITYSYEMPYLWIINQYPIAIEILRGLSGTMGVILTVPMVSVIASAVYTYKKINRNMG